MHGNIPFIFDCWAYPVVHLLLLKSSTAVPFSIKLKVALFHLTKGKTLVSRVVAVAQLTELPIPEVLGLNQPKIIFNIFAVNC